MNRLKPIFLFICSALLLSACSKSNYPVKQFKKQLTGQWKLVSQGGGFANLPETKTEDDVVVEFTPGNIYRSFMNGVPETETHYSIKHAESAVTGNKQYVIVLKGDMPYINFTVSDTELVLSGDHPDAMYFKYIKIED